MFRAYLGPSSGGKLYVYNIWYLLFRKEDSLKLLEHIHIITCVKYNAVVYRLVLRNSITFYIIIYKIRGGNYYSKKRIVFKLPECVHIS